MIHFFSRHLGLLLLVLMSLNSLAGTPDYDTNRILSFFNESLTTQDLDFSRQRSNLIEMPYQLLPIDISSPEIRSYGSLDIFKDDQFMIVPQDKLNSLTSLGLSKLVQPSEKQREGIKVWKITGHGSYLIHRDGTWSVIKVLREDTHAGQDYAHGVESVEKSNTVLRRHKHSDANYEWLAELGFIMNETDGYGYLVRDINPLIQAIKENNHVFYLKSLIGYQSDEHKDRIEGIQKHLASNAGLLRKLKGFFNGSDLSNKLTPSEELIYPKNVQAMSSLSQQPPLYWLRDQYLTPLGKLVADQSIQEGLEMGLHRQNVVAVYDTDGRFVKFILFDALDVRDFANESKEIIGVHFGEYILQSILMDVFYPKKLHKWFANVFLDAFESRSNELLGKKKPLFSFAKDSHSLSLSDHDWQKLFEARLDGHKYAKLAQDDSDPSNLSVIYWAETLLVGRSSEKLRDKGFGKSLKEKVATIGYSQWLKSSGQSSGSCSKALNR